MTDYIVGIGGSSEMMIRDTGGTVEFWFHSGPQTWNNDQQYSFGANGSGSGVREFRLVRGGGWQFVDSVYITYDQDISFTIYDAGLGFPTHTQTQHISRSTVPQPPTLDQVYATSATAIHVQFHGNYDGGSGILEWQIGYGPSSNGPTTTVSSGGISDIGGFTSGQSIYVWARGRNALGWSGWSARGGTVTWQVPAAPNQGASYNATQTSVGVGFAFGQRGTDPVNLEKQMRYGKDPTGAVLTATITVDEAVEYVYNLTPGATYYFWARTRNSVGWGPWSASLVVLLIAGARVLVGSDWKRAVPYVNVGGVWKVAEPWVKDAGNWKRTAL